MAKAVPTEHLAIDALTKLVGEPAPKVLHGAKGVPGIFAGASAAEKAAGKTCVDQRWLEPTGEFTGKGKSRKELYRITAGGVQTVLTRSDPSELLRTLQESMRQLGARTQSIPQEVEEKIKEVLVPLKEALAPFAAIPRSLQTLQAAIVETLAKIKLPSLEELTRKLSQASASPLPDLSSSPATISPGRGLGAGEWRDEVVRMAAEQKQRNAFQRLTLPQVYERLRAKYPDLSLGQYHDGLRHLQDERRIRLGPYTQALATLDDPRNALFLDREVKYYVEPC